MILELTIITPREILPSVELIDALTRSANGYSTVIVFGTRTVDKANLTKVRFGGSNKPKVLAALRAANAEFIPIRRCDTPLPRPPLDEREVNWMEPV